MNDREQGMGSVPEAGQHPAVSAGALLREARVAAGVHIESIAFSLKVPVSKIEALERDEFEALPDAVFARALAGSVCRALKIDSTPVLALLPQGAAKPLAPQQASVNASFRDASERSPGLLSRLSKPFALAVIALLVGAGVLAWFPSALYWKESGSDAPTAAASLASSATDPGPVVPVAGAAPSAKVAAAQPASPSSRPDASAGSMVEPTRAAESVEAAAAPATEKAGEAVSASPRVLFKARSESWVQVKDAQGAVVLERTLKAGESASLNQSGRLAIVVGRADATDVYVHGNQRDLLGLARENVARFEVQP
jgi:cytoskeleton protein RodZ